MSENTQIPAAQNPAENPSNAAYSDSNWKSDFDALSEIQYILFLMEGAWGTDAIQTDLTNMKSYCTGIAGLRSLCDPFVGLNPSDAAKLIASLAKPLLASDHYRIPELFGSIFSVCRDIDPSSTS